MKRSDWQIVMAPVVVIMMLIGVIMTVWRGDSTLLKIAVVVTLILLVMAE